LGRWGRGSGLFWWDGFFGFFDQFGCFFRRGGLKRIWFHGGGRGRWLNPVGRRRGVHFDIYQFEYGRVFLELSFAFRDVEEKEQDKMNDNSR